MSTNESKVLKIERDVYVSKDNQERFSYFVKGKIRGKEIKASGLLQLSTKK